MVTGMEPRLILVASVPTLPAWWDIGSCRPSTALSFLPTIPTSAVNCTDWASGNATGGIGSYAFSAFYDGIASGVIVQLASAVPEGVTLHAGQEHFCGSLRIGHANTVGVGACAGCDVPMCIVFDRLIVATPVPASNRALQGGANGPGSDFAHWQDGLEVNPFIGCGLNRGCIHDFSCVAASTPTHGSTWGAVKALYR